MSRLLTNILRLPARTLASLQRRRTPGYRIERDSRRFADEKLDAALLARLLAVPGYTHKRECMILFYLAMQSPSGGEIVEIGAFKGRSTAFLAEAARRLKLHLTSIDPHVGDSLTEFTRTVEQFNIASLATIHRAYSHDVGVAWSTPISFLWIDGAHDYDSVRQDIADFAHHTLPGAYLVFDDVSDATFPGIVRALAESLDKDPRFENLGRVKSVGVYRRKP